MEEIIKKIKVIYGKITDSEMWGNLFDKVFIIFILGVFLLILYLIFDNGTKVWVDNPTKESIFVKINSDGIEKEIPKKSYLKFSINNGKNEIFLNGKSVGKINKNFFSNISSFVNPTLTPYISEYTLYLDKNILEKGDNNKFDDKLPINNISIFEKQINGPFKKYEGLFIEGSWDYGIGYMGYNKNKEIKGTENQKFEVKEKLYRLDDFINMYNKKYVNK